MKILGRGFRGVVIADTETTVKKFYTTHEEWKREKLYLQFLATAKDLGLDIGCVIPKFFEGTEGSWQIQGKKYSYCSTLEFIPGTTAASITESSHTRTFGTHLGTVIYSLHENSKLYIPQWTGRFGNNDKLLTHLFNDKAARVLNASSEEADRYTKKITKEALAYLKDRESLLASRLTLSHQDINLPNILVTEHGEVNGLVDWGSFGLTDPTLSMYQLASKPQLWPHVKQQYVKLGGIVMDDILYAAATIHLAWAPIACNELGIDLPVGEGRDGLEIMYAYFKSNWR